jgi:hypothetical protein
MINMHTLPNHTYCTNEHEEEEEDLFGFDGVLEVAAVQGGDEAGDGLHAVAQIRILEKEFLNYN